MDYLDFEVEVSPGESGAYAVSVRSEFGEASGTMRLPFDTLALENRLQALQIALLRSATGFRRVASPEEAVVEKFGRELFDALIADGPIRVLFEVARSGARMRGFGGVRVRLRIAPPELAALPWEYLYDSARGDFLTLSIGTPVVRYIPLPQPVRPLAIEPPIRILGLIAASSDLPSLDAPRERQRLDVALQAMVSRGVVQLEWLRGGTWRDLQAALLHKGPWHILHFIGHGGFDQVRGEGFVYLSDEDGRAFQLAATSLGRLLGDHDPMRLVILNSCEGAHGDSIDVFSSTAAVIVRRGTPGVIAMQYPITDRAAIEFSRSFYGAIAAGLPVDSALAATRKAIAIEIPGGLEWGTPALYLRAPDGVLFVLPPDGAEGHSADMVAAPGEGSVASTAGLPQVTATSDPTPAQSGPVGSSPLGHEPGNPPADMPVPVELLRSRLERASGATRRLMERGWRSGHIQTLIGAELGAMAGMALGLGSQLQVLKIPEQPYAYVAIWILAVAGAFLVLILSGPPRWWKAVIWLALMFPLFWRLADQAIFASPATELPRFLRGVMVVAILALAASSLALLRRSRSE